MDGTEPATKADIYDLTHRVESLRKELDRIHGALSLQLNKLDETLLGMSDRIAALGSRGESLN